MYFKGLKLLKRIMEITLNSPADIMAKTGKAGKAMEMNSVQLP